MIKKNLVANFAGQIWSATINIGLIPIYIKYLGIESFGLIGLYGVLQICLGLLDMGMAPTISREMARFTAGSYSNSAIRNLLRSVEFISFGVGLAIILIIWLASEWLATEWLRADKLPIYQVKEAFSIMGVLISLRLIEGIYRGAIMGLQLQVLFNVVNSFFSTLRGVGAIVVLIWVSPTIKSFFLWQVFTATLSIIALTLITYRSLPKAECGAKFSKQALKKVGTFAGGVMGITIMSLLLTQFDKILLAKLLTLSEYGRYSLAAIVSSALFMVISPIATTWGPALSKIKASNNQHELALKYHIGAQLVSIFLCSCAFIMIIYSEIILYEWTRNKELAHESANLLRILALGNLINGLMWIPFQMQLAFGITRFAFRVNIISVIIVIPGIIWITPYYGAEGAAWVWVGLNAGNLLISTPIIYRHIMQNEMGKWYLEDLAYPLVPALLATILVFQWMPLNLNHYYTIAWLIASGLIALFVSSLAASHIRAYIFKKIRKFHV